MSPVLVWKNEPVSPLSEEASLLLDETLYQSLPLDDIKFENDCFEDCENKAQVASYILESLENLVDLDELIKSEPSFLGLDDKMLPLLEEVDPPCGAVAVPVVMKSEYFKPPEESPFLMMNEFEKVYFELHNGALTPPQSPPSEPPVITTLLASSQYQKNAAYSSTVPDKPAQQVLAFPQTVYTSIPTPQPDIAHELAVVDELVRTRVQDMQWSSGPSSPESSSSNGSNYGDCSSSEDPEWVPEPVENCNATFSAVQKPQKKRNKPYSHNPDDKKIRKKEQNKNAATRYRMKKKAEVEVILGEEKQLQDKHGELNGQITDLQREIKYLKGLMRDLFKAKGLIN